jgi:uncharacterized membrane protein
VNHRIFERTWRSDSLTIIRACLVECLFLFSKQNILGCFQSLTRLLCSTNVVLLSLWLSLFVYLSIYLRIWYDWYFRNWWLLRSSLPPLEYVIIAEEKNKRTQIIFLCLMCYVCVVATKLLATFASRLLVNK